MTDVSSIGPTAAQTTTSQAPETPSAAISSDFETFLRMLTTQLENQDPLNPMDSSEFAVQLATFSGVEQQVLTNDLLRDVTAQMTSSGLSQLASWVGMDAKVDVPVAFQGQAVTVASEPAAGAYNAHLVVRRSDGSELERFQISPQPGPVEWTGTDADGKTYAPGTYSFEIESYNAQGTLISTNTPAIYDRVVEARNGADGVELVLTGGTVVPATDVTALRQPN